MEQDDIEPTEEELKDLLFFWKKSRIVAIFNVIIQFFIMIICSLWINSPVNSQLYEIIILSTLSTLILTTTTYSSRAIKNNDDERTINVSGTIIFILVRFIFSTITIMPLFIPLLVFHLKKPKKQTKGKRIVIILILTSTILGMLTSVSSARGKKIKETNDQLKALLEKNIENDSG
jgi:hypothetical protein